MNEQELISLALRARERAYAPYSHFQVGAALLCPDGSVYTGCNVENASYGATICAERSAVCAAVSAGQRHFSTIAIVSSGEDPCYPCGVCRQVLQEFASDMSLLCARPDGSFERYHLDELLPHAFP